MKMGNLTCRTFSTSSSSHTHGTTSIITLCDSRKKHNVVSTLLLMPKAWRRIIVWTGGSSARRLQLHTKHTHPHPQTHKAHTSGWGRTILLWGWSPKLHIMLKSEQHFHNFCIMWRWGIADIIRYGEFKEFQGVPPYPIWHLFFYEAKWQI
jgi:hypothetical protein